MVKKDKEDAPVKPAEVVKRAQSYRDVVKGKWTPKQLAIMVLLSDPFGVTQKAIARAVGIREEYISRLKRRRSFLDDMERVADVMFAAVDILIDRATARDAALPIEQYPDVAMAITKNRELFLKRRGKLRDKLEVTNPDGSLAPGAGLTVIEVRPEEVAAVEEIAAGKPAKKKKGK